MNIVKLLMLTGLMILCYSCKHMNENKTTVVPYNVDSTTVEKISDVQVPEISEKEKYADLYSICLDQLLDEALEMAGKHIHQKTFSTQFDTITDQEFEVSAKLSMGNLFSNRLKHLIIQRHIIGEYYFDIYLIKDNQFEKVLSHIEGEITYVSDTIQDVNGDGYKDFLIDWYGSSGCCLKNFYYVYLFQPESGTFSECHLFINPTFSAREKIVRGVLYGYPGQTGLYKYKWNETQIDTIEFIYPDETAKGMYIRTDKKGRETKLKNVPEEYRNIYGYDWFTGEGYLDD